MVQILLKEIKACIQKINGIKNITIKQVYIMLNTVGFLRKELGVPVLMI